MANTDTGAFPPDYGANIRAELARSPVRLDTLLDRLEFSRAAWHRRMSGEVSWRTAEMEVIARELGIPVERLWSAG